MSEKLPHCLLGSLYTVQKSRDRSQNGDDPGVLNQAVKVPLLGGLHRWRPAVHAQVLLGSQASWFQDQKPMSAMSVRIPTT